MRIRSATGTIALLGVLVLASGCAATSGTEPASGPTQVTPAPNPDPQALAKANEFIGSTGPAEQARQVAISNCMADAGFTWNPVEARRNTIQDLIPLKPLTLEQARANGYASGDDLEGSEASSQQTLEEKEAFSGPADSPKVSVDILGMKPSVSSQGCLAESYTEVYGSVENGMMATGVSVNAVLPAVNAAMSDPVVAKANADWAKCMEASGQPNLSTPDLAWDLARQNPAVAGSVAVADAKCRETIKFEDMRVNALNRYLTTFLATNESIITEIQQIRSRAAVNAQKILSGV